MKNIKLKEIMVQPAVTAYEDEPFAVVEKKFRENFIRHLPIVDGMDVLVGLITQRDLYRIVSPHVNEEGTYVYDEEMLEDFMLSKVMTHNPLALKPEDTLGKAVEIMARKKIGCIPIVDDRKKIVGIVTETDVLKLLARELGV